MYNSKHEFNGVMEKEDVRLFGNDELMFMRMYKEPEPENRTPAHRAWKRYYQVIQSEINRRVNKNGGPILIG